MNGRNHTDGSKEKIRRNNHQVYGEQHHFWNPDRTSVASNRRMFHRWRELVKRVLWYTTDKETTSKLLGYSSRELKAHLESLFESGMSWENYGNGPGCWNIDHIRPVSSFEPGAFPREVNSLSNLRPMWAIDNRRKGKKTEVR